MARLNTKVKKYLEANSKTWDAEKDNFQLRDDGSGAYIDVWDVDGLTKPTDEQIASYETAGNTIEANQVVLKNRRKSYASIVDQLDLLYHDMTAGKLDNSGEWHKHIKAVKDANSKG
jgi:hypothetical protein